MAESPDDFYEQRKWTCFGRLQIRFENALTKAGAILFPFAWCMLLCFGVYAMISS